VLTLSGRDTVTFHTVGEPAAASVPLTRVQALTLG